MRKTEKRMLSIICSATMAVSVIPAVSAESVSNSSTDISKLSASEIVSEMGIGWNLGNSLDATGNSGLDTETSWQNPKTTKAMIDAVRDEGFTCVRIPTTWYKHMDSNYTVDSEWMARVKEVVDYCIDDGLYVVLNSHHDTWNKPIDSNYTAASQELKVLWKQIAEEFEGYDRHLVFEGMNEPRNYDGEHEWDGGTYEMHEVVNKLNADFINTVRSTGGNNTDRCLMIPTYAASSEYAAMKDLKIPEDDDNIIVSVHAYAPYSFAFDEKGTNKFTDDMAAQLDSLFKNYSNLFAAKRIPVCIGEFSATNKYNSEERVKWAKYYAMKAKELGMSCLLWDNNYYYGSGSEVHGYLNRSNCTWYDKSIVDALIESYKNTKVNLPDITVTPDLNKSNVTVLSDEKMSSSGYEPTHGVLFDFTTMKKGSFIAIQFTGNAVPLLVVQDNKEWKVWAQVSPVDIQGNVAFYSYNDIVSTYTSAYKGAYGEDPASTLDKAFQLFATGNGTDITVEKIMYVEPNQTPVTEKNISKCAVTLSASSAEYTGDEVKPEVTVKNGSEVLKNGTDYTVAYKNNVNAGTASIVITGKGSYKGSVTKNFTINSKSVGSCTTKLSATAVTFTGNALKPAVKVTVNGKEVSKDNYTVTYSDNVKAGTGLVKITGKNNLSGSAVKKFTINKKSLKYCKVELNKTTFNYTGKAVKPAVRVKIGDKAVYSGNFSVAYKNNVSKGTAMIKITGKGSLQGTVYKTFKIK